MVRCVVTLSRVFAVNLRRCIPAPAPATAALAALLALPGATRPACAQTTFTCSAESGSNCALSLTASQTTSSASSFTVPTAGTIESISIELNGVWSNGSSTGFSLGAAEFLLTGPGGEFDLLGETGDTIDGADDSSNPNDPNNGLHGLNIIIQDGANPAPMACGDVCDTAIGETNNWPEGNGSSVGNAGTTTDTVKPGSYFGYDPSNGDNPPPLGVLGDWPDTDGCNPDPILTTYNNASNCSSPTLTSRYRSTTANGTWTLTLINVPGVTSAISITDWSLTITYSAATPTSTAIISNANPSNAANQVNFTATVTSTGGTPTGTVTFTANSVAIAGCSGIALNGSGHAPCTATLGQGNNIVEASYTPSGNFEASNAMMTQLVEVTPAQSGNTWCNSSAIAAPGNSAGVQYPSVIQISGYPSGATISDVSSVELKGATGPAGVNAYHLLVAPNGQNLDFFDSTFAFEQPASPVNLTIEDGGSAPNGAGAPTTGTYEPYDGNENGVAVDSFPSSLSPTIDSGIPQVPGTINRAEPFGGTSKTTFEQAFSNAPANGDWALYVYAGGGESETINTGWCVSLDVNTGVGTTTTLSSSQNPQTTGQSVTLTATVVEQGSNNPVTSGGTVTFLDNGQTPAGVTNNAVTLNGSGQASITTSALVEGDHVITATYSGTSTDNGSFTTMTQRMNDATQVYATNAAIPNGGTCTATYCYCNAGPVSSSAAFKGAFTPDPSNIFVTNLPGTISSVSLGLNQYSSATDILYSLESMVVGPTGADLDFFSNAGWNGGIGGTASLGNYLLSDSASGQVPQSVTTLAAGPYQPSSYIEGDPNWPEPAQPYTASSSGFYTLPSTITYAASRGSGTFSSQFANTNPNGAWSLYMTEDDAAGNASAAHGWCANFTENPVAVSVNESHNGTGTSGDFIQGETGAQITTVVTNSSSGSDSGPTGDPLGSNPLRVVDTLSSALTYTGFSGTAWSCSASGQTVTCTNDIAVASGSAYPTLTLNVNVASNATSSINNSVSASGAGITSTNSNTDTITVQGTATLAISKSHTGSFTQGSSGAWTLVVSNTAATGGTSGTITVSDTLPTGYTLNSSTSTGNLFTCTGTSTVTCTGTPGIPAGGNDTITLTVNVPANSPVSVSNTASTWGGGDSVHASAGTAAISNTDTVTVAQVPASVSIVSGNNQSATVSIGFVAPLTVVVKDGGGVTISGAGVTFTAPGSGPSGTFSNTTTTIAGNTNSTGQLSESFTANTIAGAYAVTAQAGSQSASFLMTNTAAAPAAVIITNGNNQSAYVQTSFGTALSVLVTDMYGNPTSGATVTFSAPASGASASLSPVDCITAANGTCSVTATANSTAGSYDVTASVAGAIPVGFALTNNPTPNYVVNTVADDASGIAANCPNGGATNPACTLRDALAAAASAGTANITFASSAFPAPGGATITLGSAGTLTIPPLTSIQGLTTGSGASLKNLVTVDGAGGSNGQFSVFTVNSGTIGAAIGNLTIVHGSGTSIGGGNFAGGGIFNNGTLAVIDSTLSGNSVGASGEGGAIVNGGRLTMNGITFIGNSTGSAGLGGAIFTANALTITDSTFFGNSAGSGGSGGGIFNNGTLAVNDSTFSGNSAGSGGAGGAVFNPGTMTVTNTVFSEDTDGECSGANCPANGANGNIVDPTGTQANLAPLGNYGGPTETMIPLPASAAICAGLAANLPGGVTTDQRGEPNTNTTYKGYTAGSPCVDAGAVQTNYTTSFTAPVSNVAPNTAMNPGPAVTLDESGAPFTGAAVTIPLTLTSIPLGATLSGGSAATSAGVATYSSLSVNQPGNGDQLTAALVLNTSPAVSITALSGTFNVSQITPSISFSPLPAGQTYGTAIVAGSLDAVASDNSANVAGTFVYTTTVNGNAATLVAGVTVLPAGSFTITATFTPSDTTIYKGAATTANYLVTPAGLSITASSGSMTYGGTVPSITASYAGFVNGDSSTSLTAQPTCSTTATSHSAAGSYPSSCSGAVDTNYTISYTAGSVTVGQAPLTITASNGAMTYGGVVPTITASYAGFVNGDSSTSLATQPACSTTATSHSAVGSYPSSCSGAVDANYTISYTNGSVTVGSAALTVTAANSNKTYGTVNPSFTGTVMGAENGDSFTESFSTTATISSPVGAYAIVPSVTGANLADYTQSIVDGTLTVTQAASITTIGVSSASITPGQNETITATVASSTTGTPTGTVSFYDGSTLLNTANLTSGAASYSTTTLAPGVSHVISADYSGDMNFTASNSTTASVVVAPLDFTLTLPGPNLLTVVPGSSITFQINVAPDYGVYAGTVNFALSGLPAGYTTSFSPSSIAANGGPQTVTVTIQAPPATAMLSHPDSQAQTPPSTNRRFAPFALAFLVLIGAGSLRKRGRAVRRMLCVLLLLGAGMTAATFTGCGGHPGFFTQPPENYSVTVTATAANLQHSATVTLNVQ